LVSPEIAKMPVVFPHAKGITRGTRHVMSDVDFRQAWIEHLRRYGRIVTEPLPRLSSRKSKHDLEENGYQLSLEYLLRTLVPRASENTAQATKLFLAANSHIVEPTPESIENPASNRSVQGVQLAAQRSQAKSTKNIKN
jgi:hypothetical protein